MGASLHVVLVALASNSFACLLATGLAPPEYIAEMRRREKAMGIKPDPVVDAFLKATALEGEAHSVATDLMLRVLGLEVCSETQIGNEMIRGVSGGQKKRVTTGEAHGCVHLPAYRTWVEILLLQSRQCCNGAFMH